MPELTEQQIERANEELAAMADGWILSAEGWRDIAPHLQYAPAPVDGDVRSVTPLPWHYQEDSDAYTHIIRGPQDQYVASGPQDSKGNTERDIRYLVECANNAQVLQSRHDAELAEYKKALGPLSPEEKKARQCYGINASNFDSVMTHRRALLEKKPEPVDPLHGLTSKYMPETTKAVGLSLHDELIVEAFNRGRSEPRA